MATVQTGIATEFINFTRASNATVTDSDGRVKWAPHNLLLASESFDAASWTNTSVTPTANSIAAPNGTTTADTLAASGANGTTLQTFTAEAISYTFAVWLKRKTGTGNIQIAADSGTYTTVTITSDWALYTVTQTPTAGSKSAGIRIVTSADEVYAWGASLYRSDLGGMQPNTSAYPMYNPTTPKNLLGYTESFASGWAGTNGGLQGSGTELVTNGSFSDGTTGWSLGTNWAVTGGGLQHTAGVASFSQQTRATLPLGAGKLFVANLTVSGLTAGNFSLFIGGVNIGAVSSNGTITRYFVDTGSSYSLLFDASSTFDGTIDNISIQEVAVYEAPNALQTARAVDATSANGTLLSSISLLASPYTFSIWLKRKTGGGNVQLTVDGTTYATVAVTDTWTRFSTTLTPTAGTKTPGIRLVTSGDAVYAWGAQLSDSASLDSYVPVYGAAVTSAAYYGPRRDFDGATLACKGLLVEEQRANLGLNSAAFDNASWLRSALNTTGTPQWVDAATAPDGTMTADKLIPNTSSTNAHLVQSNSPITVTSGVPHTWSVYAKADGYDWIGLVAYNNSFSNFTWFNVATGAVGTNAAGNTAHPPVAVGNGWYRLSVTRTTANTVAYFILYAANGDNQPTFAGDGTKGVLVWGAQLEAGSFPTSYIPTGAATATRNADVASVSTQAFPYSASEGTIVVSGTATNATSVVNGGESPAIVELGDGTASERLMFVRVPSANTARFAVTDNGSSQASLEPGTWANGASAKMGAAYAANSFVAGFNGTLAPEATSGSIPTMNTLFIGRRTTSAVGIWNGHIRQITYLPRRISNTELQTRTA